MADRTADLERIEAALRVAVEAVRPFTPGAVDYQTKEVRDDPLTAADLAVDRVLRESLPRAGEGWLSEETADDRHRLASSRVWVVDPIDGTREFVQGIPEWCISVGLVEEGVAVAGGILNPATGQQVVGSLETGVYLNGTKVSLDGNRGLAGARVFASRSEVRRGEWDRYAAAEFEVVACGSVAYKLALVAAGLADATWTLVPKHEWDVAAGAALVHAAGLEAILADGDRLTFNREVTKLPNFLAGPGPLLEEFRTGWIHTQEAS